MKKDQSAACLFCQKYKQDGSFSLVLTKALYCKYAQSQNFYFQRDINDILENKRTKSRIRHYDLNMFDLENEYLRRFYKSSETNTRIQSLLEYYKYHINIPRNFNSNLINCRMEKVRNIQYRKIKKELGVQNDVQQSPAKKKDSSDDCSVENMKYLLKDLKLVTTQADYSKITNSTLLKDLIIQIGNCNEILDPIDFLEPKNQIRINHISTKSITSSNAIKLNIEKQIKSNQNLKAPFVSRYPKLVTSSKPPTIKIVISQHQQNSHKQLQQQQPINKGSMTTRVKSRQVSMGNIDLAKSGLLTSRSNQNHQIPQQHEGVNEGLMDFAIKLFSNQSTKPQRKTPFSQNNNFFVKGNNNTQLHQIPNKDELKLQFRSLRSKIISPNRQSKSHVGSPQHRKKQQQ
ncbi:unnamed protein product (macronuclear) [Paramecium tetraurelia]|uniref:Uncharacterized protein n=1 Tax=Paramecium tetraurelia TaxID=5888 RepID=A0BUC2_PARTE|nr:uncharacterized protein GSPATT00032371001 [Paramecium tetraurelia]CAK62139.1 unnamed protein product [Paramecium tetraurelia]|eukprot:XP_001429537.1 hypothetical protein (macronuclear) [Paramecium tetraurelia strain d4-2]